MILKARTEEEPYVPARLLFVPKTAAGRSTKEIIGLTPAFFERQCGGELGRVEEKQERRHLDELYIHAPHTVLRIIDFVFSFSSTFAAQSAKNEGACDVAEPIFGTQMDMSVRSTKARQHDFHARIFQATRRKTKESSHIVLPSPNLGNSTHIRRTVMEKRTM